MLVIALSGTLGILLFMYFKATKVAKWKGLHAWDYKKITNNVKAGSMPPVSLLINLSSNCNMRCKYCFSFFSRKQECRSYGIMDIETLEIWSKNFEFSDVTFAFQGGELPWRDTFNLIEFQRKYNKRA